MCIRDRDTAKTVIASTASPFKFSRSVMEAVQGAGENGNADETAAMDEFAVVDALSSLSGLPVPQAVEEIRTAPILHNLECDVDRMKDTVKGILKI